MKSDHLTSDIKVRKLGCETDAGNLEQLRALADELKMLIHIGSHVNILNVLGAVTQELDNG